MRKTVRIGLPFLHTMLIKANRQRFVAFLLGLSLALAAGYMSACGGTANSPTGSAPFALAIRDNPPTGVDILSFEISVTGAALQPSDTTQPPVSLLTKPVDIEMEKLQTNSAFLSTAGITAGTYNSLTLTFANPEMTILNKTGQPIVVGTVACANGQICEVKPQLNSSSITLSSAPFPLTVSANGAAGLSLDFDVNTSVQTNLTITPTLSATQVAQAPDGELEREEELVGQVSAVGNGQFTLLNSSTGQSFNISVTSTTQFSDFASIGCTTKDFSCVKTGQIVQVDVAMMGSGTLQANEVELEENVNEQQLEGTVVSINAAGNQFQVVVLDEEPLIPGALVGSTVTVNIQTGAAFLVDSNGQSIPSGVSFAGVNDLLVGQEVDIRVLKTVSGVGGTSADTDQVRLRASQISGTVGSVSAPNFTLTGLDGLYTGAGINQIQVQTSSTTELEGVASISALSANNAVSVRGLLFKTAGDPLLMAQKVRKR